MSLAGPRRRRPGDEHARARTLAAMRIDGPLDTAADRWLEAHLGECGACRGTAEAYAADHDLFAGAGRPVPPRDLWAQTAARLDRQRASGRPSPSVRVGRVPAGAVAAALVVAVVVGASVLERGTPPITGPAQTSVASASDSLSAAASPLAVEREVGLVQPGSDGTFGILTATVDQVCGDASKTECRAQTDAVGSAIRVTDKPKSVVQSPDGKQIAVVLAAGEGSSVVIVPAPASPTPAASPAASTGPTASTGPAGSASASPSSGTPSASASVAPSTATSTPTPPSSASISPSATPSTTPPIVVPSPSPTTPVPIAIASNLTVLGQSAAYSPSGNWFAFSARPTDGSQGPDIYVWHVGYGDARPLTTDHRSVFSAWIGERILGSRAEPLAGATPSASSTTVTLAAAAPASGAGSSLPNVPGIEARSVSFLLDPATGGSRIVPGDGIWRPVVDPSGRFAVYWSGTIAVDSTGVDWRPSNGTLVLARWDPSQLVAVSPSADPGASGAVPASASPATPIALLASPPVGDWDARWDETGTYLGVWVTNRPGGDSGLLTLHTVDLGGGTLDPAGAAFTDQPADSGFAIGDGRVAWVAPDGTSGSVVKVYAWAGAKGGTAETTVLPDDTLVIR